MSKLFTALYTEDYIQSDDTGDDGKPKIIRAFTTNNMLKRLKINKCKAHDKGPILDKRFKTMLPIEQEQGNDWSEFPKVDMAVSKLFKRTLVPMEDGSNFSDLMDCRIDSVLLRSYLSASALAKTALSSYIVARNLRSWLLHIQEDIYRGVSRNDILSSFKQIALAFDFLCETPLFNRLDLQQVL